MLREFLQGVIFSIKRIPPRPYSKIIINQKMTINAYGLNPKNIYKVATRKIRTELEHLYRPKKLPIISPAYSQTKSPTLSGDLHTTPSPLGSTWTISRSLRGPRCTTRFMQRAGSHLTTNNILVIVTLYT